MKISNYHAIHEVAMRRNRKRMYRNNKRIKMMYPLYKKSMRESYNFDNLKDAIQSWDCYSDSVGQNWNQMMKLYEQVIHNGSKYELHECTTIINRDIIPYLENPSMVKKDIYNKLQTCREDVKPCYEKMLEVIKEQTECDRLLENFDMVSKRFNIKKLMENNILLEDTTGAMLNDTIYRLCTWIDTYNMDYKPKLCIAAECALYSISQVLGNQPIEEEYLQETVNPKSIVENVLDYFLINYGRNDSKKFLDEVSDIGKKDIFIGNLLDDYISRLNKLCCESCIEESNTILHTEDPFTQEFWDELDMVKEDFMDNIKEFTDTISKTNERIINLKDSILNTHNNIKNLISNTKDNFDRLKLLPDRSVPMLKSAISSLLVPCRVQDIDKGTTNVLSYVFYFVVTTAMFGIGILPMIFSFIFSLTVQKIVQKIYLKDAIKAWNNHKYGVEKKIKECTDPEKKRRMEAYKGEMEKIIEKLENKYKEMESEEKLKQLKANTKEGNAEVDPEGKITPASDVYKKGESETNVDETLRADNPA